MPRDHDVPPQPGAPIRAGWLPLTTAVATGPIVKTSQIALPTGSVEKGCTAALSIAV